MKVRLLSDLHLEFEVLPIRQGGEDVVILAGDIAQGTDGIAWALKTFPDIPVVYVAGNHEFYGRHWEELIPEMRAAAAGTNVHFLVNDSVLIENVRFIGATLWTDFNLYGTPSYSMGFAQEMMADYKVIQDGLPDARVKLLPERTVERFHGSVEALKRLVEEPFSGKTVVVTHHLPTENSVATKYKGDRCNPAFASHLDEFILAHRIALWCHGHTHTSVDTMVGGTRILCNPGGYPMAGRRENLNFEVECVLQL